MSATLSNNLAGWGLCAPVVGGVSEVVPAVGHRGWCTSVECATKALLLGKGWARFLDTARRYSRLFGEGGQKQAQVGMVKKRCPAR